MGPEQPLLSPPPRPPAAPRGSPLESEELPSGPGLSRAPTRDTPVEESLFHIIHCYHQYAAREGDVETLSLEELRALLLDNVPRFMESLVFLEQTLLVTAHAVSNLPHSGLTESLWVALKPSLPTPGRKEPYYISELFRAADKNKDNQICFEEFLHVLGKLVKDYHLQYHRELCARYCAQHGLY